MNQNQSMFDFWIVSESFDFGHIPWIFISWWLIWYVGDALTCYVFLFECLRGYLSVLLNVQAILISFFSKSLSDLNVQGGCVSVWILQKCVSILFPFKCSRGGLSFKRMSFCLRVREMLSMAYEAMTPSTKTSADHIVLQIAGYSLSLTSASVKSSCRRCVLSIHTANYHYFDILKTFRIYSASAWLLCGHMVTYLYPKFLLYFV